MNTHSWNDFIDKTQGMDKRRKTQREANALAEERRGNAGKLEEFLDQTSIYEANFIFMSYSRLLSFSNFQTQHTLRTFHGEKFPHASLFGYLGQLINKSCLCWRSKGRSPEKKLIFICQFYVKIPLRNLFFLTWV